MGTPKSSCRPEEKVHEKGPEREISRLLSYSQGFSAVF